MNNPIRIHRVSFKHAFDGVLHNLRTQPNFRFHVFACLSTCLLGYSLSLASHEWLILLFTFNMVFVAEMVNTAIEAMVDLITTERKQDAKIAKDVSAGMVLISAVFAVLIGIYIFAPKVLQLL